MTSIASDEAHAREFNRRVGTSLRDVRRRRGLSLHDVEARSGHEFKASVLGAYERGERALSLHRLDRLAAVYEVPVDRLLPGRGSATGADEPRQGAAGLTIDVDAVAASDDPALLALAEYLCAIRARRRHGGGPGVTVRDSDRPAVAAILRVREPELTSWLSGRGLLIGPG